MKDEELRRRYGRASHNYAQSFLEWDIIAGAHVKLYERLAG